MRDMRRLTDLERAAVWKAAANAARMKAHEPPKIVMRERPSAGWLLWLLPILIAFCIGVGILIAAAGCRMIALGGQ